MTPAFDWTKWQESAQKFVELPQKIERADATTIQMLPAIPHLAHSTSEELRFTVRTLMAVATFKVKLMSCRFVVVSLIVIASSSWLAFAKSAEPPVVLGRESRNVEGWNVLVSDELVKKDKEATERALELLTIQLQEFVRVVPMNAVTELQKVPLWFSPEYPGFQPRAEYHPDAGWLRDNKRDPSMAKAVEFTNVRIFERETKRMPNFALHELAHAYHDRVLAKGFQNIEIKPSQGDQYHCVAGRRRPRRRRDDSLNQPLCRGADWLDEMIGTLPDGYREAVKLAEMEGLTQQEVAHQFGITLSGAKSRVQRGRAMLRNALDECCKFQFDHAGRLLGCDPRPEQKVCRACDGL